MRIGRAVVLADRVEKPTRTPRTTAEKYRALRNVADTEGFVAAAVLDVSDEAVTLERLRDIVSVDNLYLHCQETASLTDADRGQFRDIGVVLAAIHEKLMRKDAAPWSPPPRFISRLKRYCGHAVELATLPSAVLHGDYSFDNIFTHRSPDEGWKVAIIDPCPNFGSTFQDWETGPVYVDIGKFMSCLEGQVPLRHHIKLSADRINILQRAFLQGYSDRAGIELSYELASAFGYATAMAQFEHRYRLRPLTQMLARLRGAILYNRIKKNFPATNKLLHSLDRTPR